MSIDLQLVDQQLVIASEKEFTYKIIVPENIQNQTQVFTFVFNN